MSWFSVLQKHLAPSSPSQERAKRSGSSSELCTVAVNMSPKPAIGVWLPLIAWQSCFRGEVVVSQEAPCAAQVMRGQTESLLYRGTGEYKAITGTLGEIMFTFRSSEILLYFFSMCMWHCHVLFVSLLSSAKAQSLFLLQMIFALVLFSQHCKSAVSPERAMEDWSQWKENQLQHISVSQMFLLCSRTKTQSAYS